MAQKNSLKHHYVCSNSTYCAIVRLETCGSLKEHDMLMIYAVRIYIICDSRANYNLNQVGLYIGLKKSLQD